MNVRPTIHVLAFALCASVSSGEETTPEFAASIKDNNILKGEILGIDPESGTTSMRFEHARNPIDLKTESIEKLERTSVSESLNKSSGANDMVFMRNGDRFPAKVGDIDLGNGTRIDTKYSGNYTLPPGTIQRISYGLSNSPIFSGPRKEQQWAVIPSDEPTLKIKDGSITFTDGGSAAIDAGLTDCSIIDITIPYNQGRYVTLAIGSNALEASDENDPSSPPRILAYEETSSYFTGTAYVARVSGRTMTLQGATMTPEGKVRYTDLGIRFSMPNTGTSRRISIGFNRKDKVIAMWADGTYLGKYVENGDWIGTGSAIVIAIPDSNSEVVIGNVNVREWHGVISDEFATKGMQSKDVVTLVTGERFTGKLTSMNDSQALFETSLSNMTFEAANIATIDFGSGDEAPDDIPNEEPDIDPEESNDVEGIEESPPVVRFGGIYNLRGDQFKLVSDQLQFTHPILGKVTLPFMSVDSIKFR